ncbi:hypothetical protein HLB23_35285 [Nocardia uniformis]|uniref:Uncharacterized protein n=1 Tax=Nocardia uniformis TaxID=53432 RepID=A0A849CF36_9NOCA|nr:hypothetical protein [Nocardia uniformis]NNH75057.1 hypothetical protein [Nocardia uniformis]
MDADYTSDLGHTLNPRQENYRLTHPDTPDSGSGSNATLTGIDTGAHTTQGRATLNPPDNSVQWSTSGNHRTTTTTESEPAHTNSRPPEYRPTEFGTAPATNAGSAFDPGTPNTNSGGSPFGTAAPATNSNGSSFATTPASSNNSSYGTASNSSSYGTRAPSAAGASSFGTAAPATHAAPAQATANVAALTSARAAGAAPASTIEPQHVMRLLLASHDLDTAASKAEAGEGSVDDLARAAHRTRAAAVELISAWYGGTDHMRNFAEALLQAASETA